MVLIQLKFVLTRNTFYGTCIFPAVSSPIIQISTVQCHPWSKFIVLSDLL